MTHSGLTSRLGYVGCERPGIADLSITTAVDERPRVGTGFRAGAMPPGPFLVGRGAVETDDDAVAAVAIRWCATA